MARSLFCECYRFNLHVENATVLLLLAEIHKVRWILQPLRSSILQRGSTQKRGDGEDHLSSLISLCFLKRNEILAIFAPQKSGNAVLGLSYALASLSFCRTFNLDLLEASATLTIAELWLSLGRSHARRASSLVHQALPMILGHGGLELRARASIALVKCHLCDPSFSGSHFTPFLPVLVHSPSTPSPWRFFFCLLFLASF